jgi:membrane protein YqaA with SNARE-associated domain
MRPQGWIPGLLRRLQRLCAQVLHRHGTRRRTVLALAAVSAADYLLPVLPNEGMAVALGILQPTRTRWIGLAFAAASALGALAMGAVLLTLADGAQRLGLQTFGDDWQRITDYVQRFGPATLLLAAVFPSPPRAMVAATVLAGVPLATVALAVLGGKLVLYALVFGLLERLPRLWQGWRHWPRGQRRAERAMARFLAWRRWLRSRARAVHRHPAFGASP